MMMSFVWIGVALGADLRVAHTEALGTDILDVVVDADQSAVFWSPVLGRFVFCHCLTGRSERRRCVWGRERRWRPHPATQSSLVESTLAATMAQSAG